MGWLNDTMEWLGKAIPNEISKTNSVTKYIPYVNMVTQPLASADNFSTAYSDTRERGGSKATAYTRAVKGGIAGAMGSSQDPGIYGSPNVNRDIWNIIGQVGNLASFSNGEINPNSGNILNIMDNPYFFEKANMSTSDIEMQNIINSFSINKYMQELYGKSGREIETISDGQKYRQTNYY